MIGDWAERDIAGAKALGMKTAFARYGDDFNTLEPGADFELSDINQLVDIIKKLNGSKTNG
jgi:putative hydrolase of the HAD superfamily